MRTLENKEYWEKVGEKYGAVWRPQGRQYTFKKEYDIIVRNLSSDKNKFLDVGVGNGRILEILDGNTPDNAQIYGIDITEKMIAICRNKFKDNKKIKNLETCDISSEKVFEKEKFDFITAIRVLCYNENWMEMIKKIQERVNPNGLFVFTVLNNNSMNRFSKGGLPRYRTTYNELIEVIENSGFEIVEIRGGLRIPEQIYANTNNVFFAKTIVFLEKTLDLFFGELFLSRLFYVCVRKRN